MLKIIQIPAYNGGRIVANLSWLIVLSPLTKLLYEFCWQYRKTIENETNSYDFNVYTQTILQNILN